MLCPHCDEEIGGGSTCPRCGGSAASPARDELQSLDDEGPPLLGVELDDVAEPARPQAALPAIRPGQIGVRPPAPPQGYRERAETQAAEAVEARRRDRGPYYVVAGLVIAALALHQCRNIARVLAPSPERIVSRVAIGPGGELTYGGDGYPSSWGPAPRIAGWVQQKEETYSPTLPFLTHDLVVVTGDFRDPAKVEISALDGHAIRWTAKEPPSGKLWVVHAIPLDAAALRALDEAEVGRWIELEGELLLGPMRSPDDETVWRAAKGNHPTLRLRRVEVRADAPPDGGAGGG